MFRPFALAAAAATVALAIATPASAQRAAQYPGACSQMYPNADCRGYNMNSPYNGTYQARRDYRDSNAFWPGDVAVGVVGGAIGAAGAIATAPFQTGYQPDYGWNGGVSESYARRNGFVCMPGTTFRGEDGRMHLCQ
ncbi:hypothetical protein [Rhodopseudomonas pseudopalustris]|uniref:Lectin-like protein BA14k n=2 Tax=Rhodopseudomonas TaxID=1073 RepID=Q137D5_RHOPS|nr:hypothetical protein [Rhodopseudomonas pseudopalustris]ABE39804.1 conserved hypothetical protein [Rhodopseudomonas palustris BisB5]SEP36927.1 hypothetical protein SAMN05444123_11841 [Rhodopseudomonas pseudopalustris]